MNAPEPTTAAPTAPWVPAALAGIALWALLLLPLRILAQGWLPPDDAKRHAAKVVSGKSWPQIVVLRPEATVDPHPGWHALLGVAQRAGIATPPGLLRLEVVLALGLVLLPPLFLAGRLESWLATLLVVALFEPSFYWRVALGRPFAVSMAVLLALGFLWRPLAEERVPRARGALLAALFALSTWTHGNAYLWLLPLAGFAFAAGPRVAGRLGACWAAGVLAGALATGRPLAFLAQTFSHPFWAFGGEPLARQLVPEFRPADGAPLLVALVLGWLAVRTRWGSPATPLAREPFLLVAAGGWALGFAVERFWTDWGLPALCVWLCGELDERLRPLLPRCGLRRLRWTVALAAVLVLAATHDHERRWSRYQDHRFLSASDPEVAAWLPAPGGIVYNDSMNTFFDLFFANPRAEWRYVLGFEPALMPPVELANFRRIQRRPSNDAYRPWAEKLRPEDRLVVLLTGARHPELPGLEWRRFPTGHWIGRPVAR